MFYFWMYHRNKGDGCVWQHREGDKLNEIRPRDLLGSKVGCAFFSIFTFFENCHFILDNRDSFENEWTHLRFLRVIHAEIQQWISVYTRTSKSHLSECLEVRSRGKRSQYIVIMDNTLSKSNKLIIWTWSRNDEDSVPFPSVITDLQESTFMSQKLHP